jgi:hypothetical protein
MHVRIRGVRVPLALGGWTLAAVRQRRAIESVVQQMQMQLRRVMGGPEEAKGPFVLATPHARDGGGAERCMRRGL